MPPRPLVEIVTATTERYISDARKLLKEYGVLRDHDEALGDYETEIKVLPGEYARPDGCLLLAYFDGEPAGCVAFREHGDNIAEMKRLYVTKRFHGNDIGRRLALAIIHESKGAGYHCMRLDTHTWMVAATDLYQDLGFVEIEAYRYNPTKGIRFFELRYQDIDKAQNH